MYGEVNLDIAARLNLTAVTVPGPRNTGDGKPVEEPADSWTATSAGPGRNNR